MNQDRMDTNKERDQSTMDERIAGNTTAEQADGPSGKDHRAARNRPPTIANLRTGRTRSADRELAKDAGNVTSRVTESTSGTSGGPAVETRALLGGDEIMMRGTVVCPDESDFRVDIGLGGGVKSITNDVVAEASDSGASLKTNDKVRLTILETGKFVKISDDK